jgi:cytochrome b pre-mRNA-processing protein 3
MFSFPFRRVERNPTIEGLYGMIVAQARSPTFYRDYGVPDTIGGRFDMIVLHLVLVLRRLRQTAGNLPALGQQIFDRFCRDMDHNFREMGVSDLAVPKEMQRVGEAFYGRAQAYEAALAERGPGELETAVARNVLGAEAVGAGARRLAAYVRAVEALLASQDIGSGSVRFPDPTSVSTPQEVAQ